MPSRYLDFSAKDVTHQRWWVDVFDVTGVGECLGGGTTLLLSNGSELDVKGEAETIIQALDNRRALVREHQAQQHREDQLSSLDAIRKAVDAYNG